MQRHHHGSGRRTVIPADWAAAHQPVVDGTLQAATVELRDPAAPPISSGWDDASDQQVTVPAAAYWTGGARIQILDQQGKQPVAADDPESVANYLIVVTGSVHAVREGHRVKVTACDDAALSGRQMRVVTVARGSHRFERDLFCELTD